MDLLITVVYIILFVVIMAFIFSIGMLKPFIAKKEVVLILVSTFVIGALGGAFFLMPLYDELPQFAGDVEKVMPNNEETLEIVMSSASDMSEIEQNITHTKGVKSFDITAITFNLWHFNDKELEYMNSVVPNIDSHYTNYTVNESGRIDISIEDGYDPSEALKSFSDWYLLVYGDTLTYAQIHANITVDAADLDVVEQELFDRGIVADNVSGPVQDVVAQTNSSMLSGSEFTVATGILGMVVAGLGIYFDSIAVGFRKFRKFLKRK